MSHTPWQEHFKEQVQGLRDIFDTSGSTFSFLGYVLDKKVLAADIYLSWAQKNFSLPLLHSRFFTETPLSQEMFAKWATHYRWSAECLPVAEWDGSLVVACLEPPQDFPTTPSFSLVLASPENLVSAWQSLQQASSVNPSQADGAVARIPQAKPELSIEELFAQAEANSDHEEHSASSESGSLDADDGFGLLNLGEMGDGPTLIRIPAVTEIKTDEMAPAAIAAVRAPEAKEVTVSIPIVTHEAVSAVAEGQSPAKPNVKMESEADSDKTRVSVLTPLATSPAPGAALHPEAVALVTKPVLAAERTEKSKINIPVVPAAPLIPPNTQSGISRDVPSISKPQINGKPMSTPAPAGSFPLERLKKKHGSLMAEKVKKALSDMKTYFQKAMILTVDENETQVMAFAWDESFQGITDTSVRIPLKTASIFNIVTSTQKPFHGYVSLNPLNEKFFEDWNHGSIPDHITITPILSDDKVIAMMVGFADKSAYNKSSLQWAEKLSAEFIKDLAA